MSQDNAIEAAEAAYKEAKAYTIATRERLALVLQWIDTAEETLRRYHHSTGRRAVAIRAQAYRTIDYHSPRLPKLEAALREAQDAEAAAGKLLTDLRKQTQEV